MQVRDIMTKNPKTIASEATVQQAAEMMKSLDTGALPVLMDGEPRGILTDRDVTLRAVAEGRDPKNVKVGDVMTPSVISCKEAEGVDDVIRKMMEFKVRRILIEDKNGNLSGIVSLGDLALATEDRSLSGEVLRTISA